MSSAFWTTFLRAIPSAVALLSALPPAGAEPTSAIPFGHADWKPSPTDPVGFAGQGGNWYPGATPRSGADDAGQGAPPTAGAAAGVIPYAHENTGGRPRHARERLRRRQLDRVHDRICKVEEMFEEE